MHQGRMKAHGTLLEVKSQMSGRKIILIELAKDEKDKFKNWKSSFDLKLIDLNVEGDHIKVRYDVFEEKDIRSSFLKELLTAGFSVLRFEQDQPVLEDVFHELTQMNQQGVV